MDRAWRTGRMDGWMDRRADGWMDEDEDEDEEEWTQDVSSDDQMPTSLRS